MSFLVVGLGNIGVDYDQTRHNVGFMALDFFAKKHNLSFSTDRLASVVDFKYKGKNIYLIKPTTFMNLSGRAVSYWMMQHKVSIENILVLCDDLNLPFETVRIRAKGSSGGQNGLNNINEILATENYARMRIGIGNDFQKGRQVDYVLGRFSVEQSEKTPLLFEKTTDAILSFCTEGIGQAMTKYNK